MLFVLYTSHLKKLQKRKTSSPPNAIASCHENYSVEWPALNRHPIPSCLLTACLLILILRWILFLLKLIVSKLVLAKLFIHEYFLTGFVTFSTQKNLHHFRRFMGSLKPFFGAAWTPQIKSSHCT